MVSLLLILLGTLHFTSAYECKGSKSFCISEHVTDCGGYCNNYQFEMHFKTKSGGYTSEPIKPSSQFLFRDIALMTIERTSGESRGLSHYFTCSTDTHAESSDADACTYEIASRKINYALDRGIPVSYESHNILISVLQKKGSFIVRHNPSCAVRGHVLVASVCMDEAFKVSVSSPSPVFTDKSVQLQKGDQFMIPSHKTVKNSGLGLKRLSTKAKQTFEWVGINKGARLKIGRAQWKHTVEGQKPSKVYKDTVLSAINHALSDDSTGSITIELTRDNKVIDTITAKGGLQNGGQAAAFSEYYDLWQDISYEDDDVYTKGYEAGYRAAERLLARLALKRMHE